MLAPAELTTTCQYFAALRRFALTQFLTLSIQPNDRFREFMCSQVHVRLSPLLAPRQQRYLPKYIVREDPVDILQARGVLPQHRLPVVGVAEGEPVEVRVGELSEGGGARVAPPAVVKFCGDTLEVRRSSSAVRNSQPIKHIAAPVS